MSARPEVRRRHANVKSFVAAMLQRHGNGSRRCTAREANEYRQRLRGFGKTPLHGMEAQCPGVRGRVGFKE